MVLTKVPFRRYSSGGIKDEDLLPIYYKLQKEIKENIENGKWIPKKAIPPARRMAENYGVSLGTAQKAILNLVNEGYLYRIQGKGTFVSSTTTIRRERLRYIRMRPNFISEDTTYKIKLLDLQVIVGFQPVNRYLETRINENLFELRRVFIANSGPIAYTISYLPCNMFNEFEKRLKIRLERTTLYESIEQEYGFPTISNHELFGVSYADQETAEILGVEIGSPVLSVEMLSFTYKEQPYEYRITYFHTRDKKLFRKLV
jgi:GntR family transcriptional regulator